MNKNGDVDLLYEYFLSHSNLDPTNTYSRNVSQFGCGVGSFLGGMFRTVFPLLRKGSMAIGKEIVKNGANILNNELEKKMTHKNCRKNTKRKSDGQLQSEVLKKPKIVRKTSQSSKGSRGRKVLAQKKSEKKKTKSKPRVLTKINKKKTTAHKKKEEKDIFSAL